MRLPANKAANNAVAVLRDLRQAGHEAYFAGGCVRDMLLSRPCKDYDVATSAGPEEVAKLFHRTLMIGAKFGVAVVMMGKQPIEVATFRADLDYADGRRPEGVVFCSAEEDAKRRDFTINGMFYDPITDEVIDYVGGQKDLQAELIRTIGEPAERFGEDYLRLLRAARFAAKLNFSIHPATSSALRRFAPKITEISGERIRDELTKMLDHDSALQAVHMLAEYRLLKEILPELFGVGEEHWQLAWQRLCRLPCANDAKLNFAALLMDLSDEQIGNITRRWGASNGFRRQIQFIAGRRDDWREAADWELYQLKRVLADEAWPYLKALWEVREKIETGRHARFDTINRRVNRIDPLQVCPDPFITGGVLIEMGLKPGPEMGRLLDTLYNAQLNEEIRDPAAALHEAKNSSRESRAQAEASRKINRIVARRGGFH